MFFYLSKFIYFFIIPFNWLIVILFWRLITKSQKVKRVLNFVLLILFLFFGNEVIFATLTNAWQPKQVLLPSGSHYQAGILLGGLASFDKNGAGFLNGAASRLVETAILYKAGKINKVVISGGAVYNDRPTEAPFLKKKLIDIGLPADDIIIEQQSRTTLENAAYTKLLLDSLKMHGPFVLITSAMHMKRAEKVFTKAGITVIGYPSHYTSLDRKFYLLDYIIPKAYVIDNWGGLLKEVVGLWGYTLFKKA